MDLYAAARTSESHKTHDYPNCSMRSTLYHVKASVLKCTVFPTPLRIAKTKLVQPEVSRGQKMCHFNIFEGKMSHEGFSESAYHRGETIIHSEFIYSVCSIIFSTELLWSAMKARLHFVFLIGTSMEKSKRKVVHQILFSWTDWKGFNVLWMLFGGKIKVFKQWSNHSLGYSGLQGI